MNGCSVTILGEVLSVVDGLVLVVPEATVSVAVVLVVIGPVLKVALDEEELPGGEGVFIEEKVCKVDWPP